MVTGSRDRLLHIFDVSNNFAIYATLDDHSASIVSAKFAYIKVFFII
jgi:hypothetical protein